MDHFFSFLKRNSVNSFISICFSDLKDQKLPVSTIKTQIDNNRPKLLLARWAHKWSRQLACSNYGPNLAIGMSANVKTWFLWNYFKIWPVVSENKIFFALYRHEFLHVCIVQKAPIHQSHIYRQIKISENFANSFSKGSPKEHSCEIISKSDQQFRRIFFKNFFMSLWCEKPQFTRAMFMKGSKFREHFLKRVTQGTFLWNYFKIWPAVSEKKIF